MTTYVASLRRVQIFLLTYLLTRTGGLNLSVLISERFRDKELIYKALYKFAFFTTFYFLLFRHF